MKFRIIVLASIVLGSLLTSCGLMKNGANLSELSIHVNSQFQGDSVQWRIGDPVSLTWKVSESQEIENYRISITSTNGKIVQPPYNEDLSEYRWDFSIGKEKSNTLYTDSGELNFVRDGNSRKVDLVTLIAGYEDHPAYPLALLAASFSGQEFKVNLRLLDDSKKKSVSQSETWWTRPNIDGAPNTPKLEMKWDGSDYPDNVCGEAMHSEVFAFNSIPTYYIFEINGKEDKLRNIEFSNWVSLGSNWGEYPSTAWVCPKKAGIRYKIGIRIGNLKGDASGQISAVSPAIKKSESQRVSNSIPQGCESPLAVTEFTAAPGMCGSFRVEVFQSDLNTGDCSFLGYWNDANNSRRIGVFRYCDHFIRGSMKENSTYQVYARILGTTSYTTLTGSKLKVIEFRLGG